MNPQVLTTTISARQHVAILRQFSEHALGIDQVLGAAKANEGESLGLTVVFAHIEWRLADVLWVGQKCFGERGIRASRSGWFRSNASPLC
jgi:hypothetical protein